MDVTEQDGCWDPVAGRYRKKQIVDNGRFARPTLQLIGGTVKHTHTHTHTRAIHVGAVMSAMCLYPTLHAR